MRKILRLGAVAALLLAFAGGSAMAADFYKGKTIKLITSGSAGGGYDTHTRLVATHITKHIPGNPNIIVQNMTEGSGVAASNHLFFKAKQDGTVLGQFNRDSITRAIVGVKLAKYTPSKFQWLGSSASYSENAFVIFVRYALPYKGIAEMRKAKKPVVFGNRGTLLVPLVGEGLGANVKMINGYKGREINLALERGEIDGGGTSYSNILRRTPHWIPKKVARLVVQYGHAKRIARLPDVPTAQELAQNSDDLALVKFGELPLTFGYPFTAPPGTPKARVALLRRAFAATMKDKAYIKAVKKAKLEFTPQTGEELQAKIDFMSATPAKVLARYNKLTGEAGAATP